MRMRMRMGSEGRRARLEHSASSQVGGGDAGGMGVPPREEKQRAMAWPTPRPCRVYSAPRVAWRVPSYAPLPLALPGAMLVVVSKVACLRQRSAYTSVLGAARAYTSPCSAIT